MTLPRIFLFITIMLFGAIGVAALVKKKQPSKIEEPQKQVVEIDIASLQPKKIEPVVVEQEKILPAVDTVDTPECDRIDLLFKKDSPLPIVTTLQYKSKVPWKSGRSAWLVDYAAHYKTHLHFIARSLNGRADYNPKPAAEGQSFNVLAQNVNFYFYALIDISRCKLMLYAMLPDAQERILLKTYRVSLGRLDSTKPSGSLTPIGKYSLGSRIAIYQPKMMGTYKGKRTEMITVFGTRWIPFDKELGQCSEPAKGYGIHGTPWQVNAEGKLADNTDSIGRYESDGCIRLRAADIEELFAIVSSHETVVEIVPDFSKVLLPGKEKLY